MLATLKAGERIDVKQSAIGGGFAVIRGRDELLALMPKYFEKAFEKRKEVRAVNQIPGGREKEQPKNEVRRLCSKDVLTSQQEEEKKGRNSPRPKEKTQEGKG